MIKNGAIVSDGECDDVINGESLFVYTTPESMYAAQWVPESLCS